MNRSKWKSNRKDIPLLALKLAEEAGEVAAEAVNISTDGKNADVYLRQMHDELEQVEFIVKVLRREVGRRLDKLDK